MLATCRAWVKMSRLRLSTIVFRMAMRLLLRIRGMTPRGEHENIGPSLSSSSQPAAGDNDFFVINHNQSDDRRELIVVLSAPYLCLVDVVRSMQACRTLRWDLPRTVRSVDCTGTSAQFSRKDARLQAYSRNRISNPSISNREVSLIVATFTQVVDLDVRWCHRVTSAVLPQIARLSNLCALRMDSTRLASINADALSCAQGLEVLSLKSCTRIINIAAKAFPPSLKELYLSFSKVIDLVALEVCTQLEVLDLGSSLATDISPLKNCTALRVLHMNSSAVQNLEPLGACVHLRALNLSGSKASDFNLKLKGLEVLHLNRTRVASIEGLVGCPRLRTLSLDFAPVSDVTALGSLACLRRVSLSATDVEDVTALSTCSELDTVILFDTRVRDVAPLQHCKRLRELNIDYTRVQDVTALASCVLLKDLKIFNTRVVDISALAHVERVSGFSLGHDAGEEGEDEELHVYGSLHQHTAWEPATLIMEPL